MSRANIAQVLVASEGEVAEEDEGEVDDVGAAKRAVRRTQGSLASMSGAGGLVRLLQLLQTLRASGAPPTGVPAARPRLCICVYGMLYIVAER